MRIYKIAALVGIATLAAGCHSESSDSPAASASAAAGPATPAANGAAPATAKSAADLQRIQNDPNLTPKQKADAIRQFTGQSH